MVKNREYLLLKRRTDLSELEIENILKEELGNITVAEIGAQINLKYMSCF